MDFHQLPFDGSHGQWHQLPDPRQYRSSNATPYEPLATGGSGEQRSQQPSMHSHDPIHQSQYGGVIAPNAAFMRSSPNQLVQDSIQYSWTQPTGSEITNRSHGACSKSPSFANILQGNHLETSSANAETSTKKKARRRGQVHPRISPNNWEKYKEYLKDLYLVKLQTALQIKEHMNSDFKFDASEQQYKNKFSEWGFSKKLRKDGPTEEETQWIIAKRDERERDGKKTEFLYHDRMVPVDRIQESARKGKTQMAIVPIDKATPIGLTYSTPAPLDAVPSPFHADPLSSRTADPVKSNASADIEAPSAFPLNLRLKWEGYSLQDFETMVTEAEEFSEMGRLEEAEQKLLEALNGFENLLPPCHQKTISLAYQVAEFYAKSVRMQEADDILEKVSKNFLTTWGLQHSKTIAHMLYVTDLYYAWSRPNDALSLLLRAFEYFHDPPIAKDARVREVDHDAQQRIQNRPMFMSRLLSQSEPTTDPTIQPRQVEFLLMFANAQVRAKDEEAEPILLDLIKQCERFPAQFLVQSFKTHCSLLDLYYELNKLDKRRLALKNAKAYFFSAMKKEKKRKETKLNTSLLNAAIDLAGRFVQTGRFKDAELMFDCIEEEATTTVDTNGPDNPISFLIAIGMIYQRHGKWKYARPRFEHAHAITIALRGPHSMMARRLEAALDNQEFSMGSLPLHGHSRHA